jgi:hypothetical protein
MAELVREAVHAYVTREPQKAPPGAGAFASGHADTASRSDDVLRETGFGGAEPPAAATKKRRAKGRISSSGSWTRRSSRSRKRSDFGGSPLRTAAASIRWPQRWRCSSCRDPGLFRLSAFRNLLMEPNFSNDLTHEVKSPLDLTLEAPRDMGW